MSHLFDYWNSSQAQKKGGQEHIKKKNVSEGVGGWQREGNPKKFFSSIHSGACVLGLVLLLP